MSEEVNEVQETTEEVVVTESSDSGSRIDNLKDALKELDKVRKEAAARRVQSKENEEKASKWEEHVRSQKTDLERLTEDKEKLAEEAKNLRLENLRNSVAIKTGLDPELVEFLTGETEDELTAKAKKLIAKSAKPAKPADFFAGQRGTAVGKDLNESINDWFADAWNKA